METEMSYGSDYHYLPIWSMHGMILFNLPMPNSAHLFF